MVCKDGTLIPIYFVNNLFYMPYLTPISESQASGGHVPKKIVKEATLLSSNVAIDKVNNVNSDDDDDCEVIVWLDARPAPKN